MKNKTIMMLGDSITAGFETEKYFPDDDIINMGVSGDSTGQCLKRISEKWFYPPSEFIFLCIGTNDFARGRTNKFIVTNIKKIIEKIQCFSAYSKIYIVSIFPTRENAPRPNERICECNECLRLLSFEMGCSFFDLHPHFRDEDGMLKKEYTNDGLHLTEAAYTKWSSLLEKIVRQ